MLITLCAAALAAPAAGYVDLHIHLAAHLTVPVYGAGLEAEPPAVQSNLHGLVPQLFVSQLAQPGPAILVSLAYANPFATAFETRRGMRARIERQLAYVEAFVARHDAEFGVAHTPQEARVIAEQGRVAIVHGIEGGTGLFHDPDDAARWAQLGVAVVTPVHLSDNPLGGAWCQEGMMFSLNVWGCFAEAFTPKHHGLTVRGVHAVNELVDAGIVVDLAHASDASFAGMIPILRARDVAPVYTHVTAYEVRHDSTALTDAQIGEIYALGGLVGVTGNLTHVSPRPTPKGSPDDRCPGSIDDFRLHWDHVVSVVHGQPVAWGSDFQGGVDHLRPKYGPRGCASSPEGRAPTEFDTSGLAHAGLVEPMFAELERSGSDRSPLDASAERFLSIWERSLAAARR